MSAIISFVERHGWQDVAKPLGEYTKAGLITAAGGIATAVVTNCALSALGIPPNVGSLLSVIPMTVGIIGTGASVIGTLTIGLLFFKSVNSPKTEKPFVC